MGGQSTHLAGITGVSMADKEFSMERRYITIKLSDVARYLAPMQKEILDDICELIDIGRQADNRPPLKSVVIEADWPCYEDAQRLVEDMSDKK